MRRHGTTRSAKLNLTVNKYIVEAGVDSVLSLSSTVNLYINDPIELFEYSHIRVARQSSRAGTRFPSRAERSNEASGSIKTSGLD